MILGEEGDAKEVSSAGQTLPIAWQCVSCAVSSGPLDKSHLHPLGSCLLLSTAASRMVAPTYSQGGWRDSGNGGSSRMYDR